ncbi:protein SMG5 [Aricia agestis]|uniref:protein SMG5 n=1 Tax=Aricia agestis TaxID=91739 RepID=UPI001C20985B|nr:protein SMG5 [Aricia agestis]
MNGCNEDFVESKIVERNDRAKKIYRYVTDIARRLGDATSSVRGVADLFTLAIELQRQKLRDNCEKLFFLDPENYGKKSLELLWRKVYYDTISAAKKHRENDNKYDNHLFTLITSGIGQFNNMLLRIQSDLHIDMKELDFVSSYDDEETEEQTPNNVSDEDIEIGKTSIYSCLIYLGDLSRYQVEIFNLFEHSLAARYYLQASQIDCQLKNPSGMPFNQLGNLYLGKNFNLDSACFYIHCLSFISPFEGAAGNLTKIFEKNAQFCDLLSDSESLTQTEHMQVTIANFLSLIEIWYLDKEDSDISKMCSVIVQQFKIAMNFNKPTLPDKNKNYTEYTQALEEENINPSYMNSIIIYNIVKICLFTISKLNENNEAKAFACKAFTLALLSQILQKLLAQVQSIGLKNPACKYNPKYLPKTEHDKAKEEELPLEDIIVNGKKSDNETIDEENVSDEDNKVHVNGDSKNNKKTIIKRRRRRRIDSSDSSDVSDADSDSRNDNNSSDSDDDLSDSTYKSDDESKSDRSASDDDEEAEYTAETNGIAEEEPIKDIKVVQNDVNNSNKENGDPNALNITELQNFLMGDNFLASIKLLIDWVLNEKDLIVSCGQSGEALFQCVVDLLNTFTHYFTPQADVYSDEKVVAYVRNVAKKYHLEYKSIPLTEDINLRGTNICKFDKDAAEWQTMQKIKPLEVEENVIRILHFIDFGYNVSKIIPRIRYNKIMKIYYFKKIPQPKVHTKLNHKRSREWHNTKKQENTDGGLLRRLGRLWLTSQVHELERSEQVDIPTLLAVDTAALHEHLRRVKQLLRTKNFIFLVPSVVLQELDELKRDRSTARDAIRWLEMQLKSGSRFLRTQKPGQSKPLPLLKYPRKAPQNILNFVQILEFCNHFIADEKQMHGTGDADQIQKSPLLILLVGNELGKGEEYKDFSLKGAAKSAGISVENISDYYTKWRQAAQRSGKKR